MQIDTSGWSGEGGFTQVLVDHLKEVEGIAALKVEDAPASRSEADYNFVSNEIFVAFASIESERPKRRFGFLPRGPAIVTKAMTVAELEVTLAKIAEIGSPDYSDETMLQYLRTERVVPPYQTRGYKLVELVRIYEARVATATKGP